MTTMLINAEQRTLGLPADLRQHLSERALINLALEAVQTVGDRFPRPPEAEGPHSPQMLLTLVTYCYAAGIYGSEDIEYDCRNDAALRYLCGNTSPDQETIRNFRRANRAQIEDSLALVYRSAGDLAPARISTGTTDLAGFARRRLELAVLFDMAMCD